MSGDTTSRPWELYDPNVIDSLRQELATLKEENDFLHAALDAFEWQRINTLSRAEVEQELLEAGYTKERLDAGLAKIRATVEAAIAQRGTIPKEDNP